MGNVLRPEIIAAQTSRSSLFQHKLTIVAAIGAVGFGLDVKEDRDFSLLWQLIPWVCIYVDLLTHQLDIRIMAIHHFFYAEKELEKAGDYHPWDEGDYEQFASLTRKMDHEPLTGGILGYFGIASGTEINAFRFERDLVDFTTIALIIFSVLGPYLLGTPGKWYSEYVFHVLAFGAMAIVVKFWLMHIHALTRSAMEKTGQKWINGKRETATAILPSHQ